MVEKPKNKELEKAEKQLEAFEDSVQQITLDRSKEAPKFEMEQQTKIAQKDLDKKQEIYLKPSRAIGSKEKFNEEYRDAYNFAKEYVNFIAENYEIVGETIEMWTKPFPGMPAEFWKVPTNKPVWGPRYLADQIKRCSYHRMKTADMQTGSDDRGTYFGQMIVDNEINRLDARPVSSKRSVFMNSAF